ncbi:MAG: beta-galactosidase [Rikenellaceae bacterium]|nr:beta-galactosidase [Rikenellaceae bacterium]
MKRYIFGLILSLFCLSASARQVFLLNDDWQFFYKTDVSSDVARRINLPHTWNLDALSGEGEYLKTVANYSRTMFIPQKWEQKRLFIKFYGVQSVADVFVNGHHVGEHRGGWTAFTFEITQHLRFGDNNQIVVVVNNSYQNDVLPTSSEINLYGGIYRDVELIVTEQTTISPLHYGCDGILVHQNDVSNESVNATVSVYPTSTKDKLCDLFLQVKDPAGEVVYSRTIKEQIRPGAPIDIPFTINNPQLWHCEAPKLYTVSVAIGRNHEDEVSVKTGFRKIEVEPQVGLKINGKLQRVHGVTLYHDRAVIGSALRSRHYDEDMKYIIDMGANAIRSATAPHAQHLYDVCDQNGMLVWIDTPFTRAPYLSDVSYFATPRFRENGLQQLREIIIQNYNHPSVVMWGIYSLVWMRGDDILGFVKELNSTAKSLDASRPTVACSNQDGEINFVPDLIVWQQNLGLERGIINDLSIWIDKQHKDWAHLRSAVAYGAPGSINLQINSSLKPVDVNPQWEPERWQTDFHEGYTRYLGRDTLFWGTWINNMFEFGSVRHTDGISRAGLVTFDRNNEKDAYFLYRAMWNKKSPTLHLTDKRRNIRQDSIQQIKFYSSVKAKPTLVVNRDTVRVREYAPCQFISDSIVMTGQNNVVLSAGELSDQQIITIGKTLKPRP